MHGSATVSHRSGLPQGRDRKTVNWLRVANSEMACPIIVILLGPNAAASHAASVALACVGILASAEGYLSRGAARARRESAQRRYDGDELRWLHWLGKVDRIAGRQHLPAVLGTRVGRQRGGRHVSSAFAR